MPGGRQGLDYIALRIQREPLDQTDLSNSGDAILKVVGNRHTKQGLIGGPRGCFLDKSSYIHEITKAYRIH